MTRPRSQQINDPSTKYNRFTLSTNPTPGATFTTISGATYTSLINSSATQQVGGCESPTQATLVANALDPYALSAGNSFSISVDGNTPVLVSVLAGDIIIINGGSKTTGHRLASRINTVLTAVNPLWVAVASRTNDGFLKLVSPTSGSSSSISITGNAGILQTLGFGNGVTTAASAFGSDISRGIITKSNDLLGGFVFPCANDNSPVLSVSDDLYTLSLSPGEINVGNAPAYVSKTPSGSPVYGKISNTAINTLTINWYSKCDGSEPIRSSFSDFTNAGLVGQILNVSVVDQFSGSGVFFSTTFSGPIINVSDVANQINASYQIATGGQFGVAVSSLREPYFLDGTLRYKINGVSVNSAFSTGNYFASDVVLTLNNDITAALAAGAAFQLLQGFYITSNLAGGGENSTVEILSTSDSSVLRALGLSVGKFRGWNVCRVVGAEIEISIPSPNAAYFITGSAIPLLGLSTYPYPPVIRTKEVAVGFPSTGNSTAFTIPTTGAYSILFPELMEAGDIPDNIDTLDKLSTISTPNIGQFPNVLVQNNAVRFGNSARYGRDGNIQSDSLPFSIPQIKIGNFVFNNSTFAPSISFPYTVSSYDLFSQGVSSGQPSFRQYIIDDSGYFNFKPSYTVSINLEKTPNPDQFNSDINGEPSSLFNLSENSFTVVIRNSGEANPYDLSTSEIDFSIQPSSFPGADRNLALGKDSVLYFENYAGKISDVNIESAVTAKFIPISDLNNNALKAHDQILDSSTLFQHVNARIEVTVGDGVDTFGDLNGPNALDDVITLLNTDASLRPAVIYLKKGTYIPVNTLSFTRSVTIIGNDEVSIAAPTGGGDTLSFTGALKNIRIENLNILSNTNFSSVVSECSIEIYNCNLNAVKITTKQAPALSGSSYAYIESSRLLAGSGTNNLALEVIYGSGSSNPSILIKNSLFSILGLNSRCVRVTGLTPASSEALFNEIKFEDCSFVLAPCSVSASGGGYTLPYATSNTGLIELNPINDGRTSPGLVIDRLIYKNCTVSSTSSTNACIIIQLCSATTGKISTNYASPNEWGTIRNISFDGCKFSYLLKENATRSLCAFALGFGIEHSLINNCDFYPILETASTGKYGNLPEWWLFNDSTVTSANRAGIALGTKNSVFSLNRIHNITPNVSNSTTNEIEFYYGKSLAVTGNSISPDSDLTRRGNGTADRTSFFHIKRAEVISPIYDSNAYAIINNNILNGLTTLNPADEWATAGMLVEGSFVIIENNQYVNWLANTPSTPNYAIQVSDSKDITIRNNVLKNTQYGVDFINDCDFLNVCENLIECGSYLSIPNNSSGIRYDNSGNTAQNVIIDKNKITDAGDDTTYAGIDVVIGQYEGSGLTASDKVSPACVITNNYVDFGGWASAKNAYALRPSQPAISGDRDPKAIILGNTARVAYNLPLFPNQALFGSFYILRWNSGTSTYVSIDGLDIPRYKLIGAHTDNNKVESYTSTPNVIAAGTTALSGDYMVITNLPEKSKLSISFDMLIDSNTLDSVLNCSIKYSVNSGATWNFITNSTRAFSTPGPSKGSSTVSTVLDITSATVWIDIFADTTAAGSGNVFYSFNASVVTPKPVYQSNTTMLMNSCVLVP